MPIIRIDDEVWAYLKSKATPFEDAPNDVLRREFKLVAAGVEAKPNSGTETAKAILSPPPAQPRTTTDYFAKDRKGNIPVTPPKDAQLRTVNILQIKEVNRTTPYMEVIFTGGKGNCFDKALWPLLKKHEGRAVQIWTTVSDKYTNVVGVRA